MRNATMWIVLSQLIAVNAWASDLDKAVDVSNDVLANVSGISMNTNGTDDISVDVTTFPHLRQHVALYADPPSEVTGDPPSEKEGDPPTEYSGDPPMERGAGVVVDLSADGQTLVVYLADPPDPDYGTADPPDPDADPPDPDADPPDPDHQIRIVVDQASIGSLTFVDSMGLPLILVGVGDPFVGETR